MSMDKKILQQLVKDGLSSHHIAKKLNISQTTSYYWIRRYNLTTQKKHHCRKCGESNSSKFSPGRFTECRKCRVLEQKGRYKKYKKELIDYMGGKCQLCGYNKCMAALDFHHKNPEEKNPNWKNIRSWTPSKSKKEIDKCILVCRNCHSEIHYPDENRVW